MLAPSLAATCKTRFERGAFGLSAVPPERMSKLTGRFADCERSHSALPGSFAGELPRWADKQTL
jgi:hypothetical protein